MADRVIAYDINDNMIIINNPDLVHITGSYSVTANTDINASATIDIPFNAADYSSLSGFVTKSSATQFDIVKAGVYRIEFYCSSDESLAEVRIDIEKHSGATYILARSAELRNCNLYAIGEFAVDDYIIIKANRVGVVTSSMNISSGYGKLIITKLG
jgi:hypothetical protein